MTLTLPDRQVSGVYRMDTVRGQTTLYDRRGMCLNTVPLDTILDIALDDLPEPVPEFGSTEEAKQYAHDHPERLRDLRDKRARIIREIRRERREKPDISRGIFHTVLRAQFVREAIEEIERESNG